MNEQLDLLTDRAHARRTDPGTSHTAARAAEIDLRQSQLDVLDLFKLRLRMTDQQLLIKFEALRETYGWKNQSDSGLRTRRSELVRAGLVRDSGRKALLKHSTCKGIVWELATNGRSPEIY